MCVENRQLAMASSSASPSQSDGGGNYRSLALPFPPQMTKRSHHRRRSSSTPSGSYHQFGCIGNLLHFFDFHQHLHIRRMLMDRKHDEGKLSTGTKHGRNKPTSKPHGGFLDIIANFTMKYSSTENSSDNNSPPTRTSSVDKEKPKVSSTPTHKQFPSRMRRTLSIHRLNCDDYVLQDTTTDTNSSSASTEEVSLLLDAPHGVDHNQPDEFSRSDSVDKQALLQEKLNEAKSYANELKEDFKVNRAKSFLDALELFNANREMFLKIIQDPNSLSEKYLQYLQDNSMDRTLPKCDSNPESRSSSGHRRTETEPSNRPRRKYQFFTNFNENLNSVGNSDELSMYNNHNSYQYHLKDTKKRIKDVMKESKSRNHWISMDGVLHRVPYGNNPSYQVFGQGSSTSSGKKYVASRFRKSLSLTESLDRYSSLFGSPLLGGECKKQESNRSQLIQQDGVSLVRNSSKTLKRIHSLPDFATCTDKDAQCEVPEVISFLRTPSVEEEVYIESDDATENECHAEIVTENSASVANVLDELREEIAVHDPLLHDLDSGSESDLSGDPDETFRPPDSIKCLQENSISQSISLSEVHSEWEGSSDHYSDELDSNVYSRNQINPETFDADQTVSETINKTSRPNTPNLNYVLNILKKSGFNGKEFLGRWYSPDLPLDPSLFEELEGLNWGTDIGSYDESNINLDHLLLFDLINEVLLEICESSFAINPWLICFNNRPVKPVHVGSHGLGEVWETINCHLNFHPAENPTVEYVVSRDLTEMDKWMNNIGYQTDDIGVEIEDMILENLLDEAVSELF